jgi:hypothetical protein
MTKLVRVLTLLVTMLTAVCSAVARVKGQKGLIEGSFGV